MWWTSEVCPGSIILLFQKDTRPRRVDIEVLDLFNAMERRFYEMLFQSLV